MKNLNLFILLSFLAFVGVGCSSNEAEEPGGGDGGSGTNDTRTYVSISSILEKLNNAEDYTFTAEEYVKGTVTGNDESGNIYKLLYIQDGDQAIRFAVDATGVAATFPVGGKVVVNLKDLTIGKNNNNPEIGAGVRDAGGVNRIDAAVMNAQFTLEGDGDAVNPTTVSVSDYVSNYTSYLNKVVKFENVQFSNEFAGAAYAIEGENINTDIVDCNGNTVILRNSGYSDFYTEMTPEGNGTLMAIANVYKETPQLVIRNTADVDFSAERCGDTGGGNTGSTDILGGGSASAVACYSNDFEAYEKNDQEFDSFYNGSTTGKFWQIREYGDNKYLQMNAYQNGEVDAWTLFSVDFDKADLFSFASKDGYNNGEVLTVLYSTNYNVGDDLEASQWMDITDQFTIASGTSSGYASDFTASGEYSLENISGKGYIAFRYVGSEANGLTTTMQIDNVIIKDNEDTDCSSDEGDNGGNTNALGCIIENFEGYTKGDTEFSEYTNIEVSGSPWIVKEYSDNKYIQQKAYQNGEVDSWFLLNVDFDKADVLSFETKDAYNNGDVLTVLYSTGYVEGDDLDASQWMDITDQFHIASGSSSGYAEYFTESGDYSLENISGQGYIAFRYVGSESGGLTTTIQIDNIMLIDNDDSSCNL